jgi:hypothetical protein
MLSKRPGDPVTQALRNNYAALRQAVPELPEAVGVVTYHEVNKCSCVHMRNDLRSSGFLGREPRYAELDMLEALLKMRDQDISDPLVEESIYRVSMYLLPLIMMDKEVDALGYRGSMLAFPFAITSFPMIASIFDKIADMPATHRDFSGVLKRADEIKRELPNWDTLQSIHDHVAARFAKNRVSRDFPLYSFPPGWLLVKTYGVGLRDEIVTPGDISKILSVFKGEDLEDVTKAMAVHLQDLFGVTVPVHGFDQLMASLPQPRTLITDLYIVDEVPQIADMDYITQEFRFS